MKKNAAPGEGRRSQVERALRPLSNVPPNQDTKSTPAVLYGAKSTEDKHESIPTQIEEAREMAEEKGWVLAGVYTDEGFSAYSGNRGPSLEQAKRAAADAAADRGIPAMLVAQAADRFARGAGDAPGAAMSLGEVWHQSRRANVHLRSVEDDEDLRDEASVAALGRRAMMESRRKSRSVKKGMKRRAARGLHNGRAPLGYRNVEGRLEVIESEAEVVRRIYAEYVAGRSQQAITRDLCLAEIKTKHGGEWHQGTAGKVLSNRVYVGERLAGGEWVDGDHKPLIDPQTWTAAQTLKEASRKSLGGRGRRPAGSHLFRNKQLRCGTCGESMVPRTDTSRGYETYYCIRRKREGPDACSMPNLPRVLIDDSVRRYFENVGLDIEATRASVADAVGRRSAEARALREDAESEEQRLRAGLARIERDYVSGELSGASYDHLTAKLAPELEAASAAAGQHRKREREVAELGELRDFEEDTLRDLAHIRQVIVGEVTEAGGESVERLRVALLTLFEGFVLHHLAEESQAHPARQFPRYTEPDLLLAGHGGLLLESLPRPHVIESAAPPGYGDNLVFPVLRRVPLPAKNNGYEGLPT